MNIGSSQVIRITQLAFVPAVLVLLILVFGGPTVGVASDPPTITGVRVEEVSENRAVIRWQTDREADSLINYGLDRNFGIVRSPGADKTDHELEVDNLLPGTTYYFQVVSRDVGGNQSVSSDFRFTTEGRLDVSDLDQVSDMTVTEQVEEMLSEVDQVEDIQEIRDMVEERAREIAEELSIVGRPEVIPDENSAVVRWVTNRPATSRVEFEADASFDPDNPQFSRSQSGDGTMTDEHEVTVEGLEPATTYHLQAVSEDDVGVEARSPEVSFQTEAVAPTIQNLELVNVGEDYAILEWNTSIPAESRVEYEHLESGEVNSVGSPTLSANHSVRLSELEFGDTYRAVAMAIGEDGGVTESDPLEFETVIDEDPPVVSNVSTESTLFPGAEARVQTIVSWRTNKLAVCKFNYQEGLAPGVDQFELEPRDTSFMTEHIQVVTDFRPATVYQFWFVCRDRFGNEGKSETFVVFTPQQEQNIIDLIMENFEETFGWARDIFQ